MAIDGSSVREGPVFTRPEPAATRSTARVRAFTGTALLVIAVGAGILFADPFTVGALIAIVALLYLFRSAVFSWPGAAVAVAVTVCLVPARRYTLPVNLPFAAEPYRVVVVVLLAVVISALLIDPAFRWRKLTFSGPVGVFLATQLISIAVNLPGLAKSGLALNAVSTLVSLILIGALFVVTRQILQSARLVHTLIAATVICGTIVGALATVERVTRYNLFLKFFDLLPLHRLSENESVFVKAGTARAFGSAQHPIALAVFLIMLVPLGIYLARHAHWPRGLFARELFWIACTMIMMLGMLAAVARTAFISILVMLIVAIALRPAVVPKVLFYGILGTGIAMLVSARNIISMVSELLDPKALIASQETSPGWTGSGRLADLAPSLQQAGISPFFGTGLGSRVTIGPSANAFILDDQFLTSLLESGIIGVLGIAVLTLVPFGRLAAYSRRAGEPDDRRDLALALAIGIIGYVVALFFFDGFSFIQTLLTFFLLLALGSWVLTGDHPTATAPASRAVAERETVP